MRGLMQGQFGRARPRSTGMQPRWLAAGYVTKRYRLFAMVGGSSARNGCIILIIMVLLGEGRWQRGCINLAQEFLVSPMSGENCMESSLKISARRHRSSGFSLVELVVVLAVVLIVAAVAVPNGIRIWYNMEVRATASQVSDLIQRARIMAAKNNAYYTVCYRSNNGVQQVYLTQVVLTSTTACTYTQGTSIEIDLARLITAASAAPSG